MYTGIIGLALLLVISIIGLVLAELKYKVFSYQLSEEEKATEERALDTLKKNGYNEMGISDVIKTISSTGFAAI